MNIDIQGGDVVRFLRNISCFTCVVLLIIFMAVPAMAAESYVFPYYRDGAYCLPGSLPSGRYLVSGIFASGEFELGVFDISFAPGLFLDAEGLLWTHTQVLTFPDLGSFSCEIEVFNFSDGLDSRCFLLVTDLGGAGRIYDSRSEIRFTPVESSTLDPVSGSLDTVIAWVGMVLDSFMAGPLAPLLLMLAIPIAVTALIFSIKAIRKNSWGA